MKIICFIDSLCSGGAQRQLTTLAVGFKKRGHEVRFLVYHPHPHFKPLLDEQNVPCQLIQPCSRWQRTLVARRVLREGWQDVVLAFLEAPCLYAQLARVPRPRWGLVAGERLADPRIAAGGARWLRQGHRLAHSVVANSHTNRLMLAYRCPFLKKKLTTIYNMVDLRVFRPHPHSLCHSPATRQSTCRIVVAASYQGKKNMLGLAQALLCLRDQGVGQQVVVDWYGAVLANREPFDSISQFVAEYKLEQNFRLHLATQAINDEFVAADAVGLFSHFEGLPNVVCEGMASGKPILLSNVCDAGSLVHDERNGFLCDPASPESMAGAIKKLAQKTKLELQQMGQASRRMAERLFDADQVVGRYERILEAAAQRGPMPPDNAWPDEVPESARTTAGNWAARGRFLPR